MRVLQSGREIATLIYMTDTGRSIQTSHNTVSVTADNTPIILSAGFSLNSFSVGDQ